MSKPKRKSPGRPHEKRKRLTLRLKEHTIEVIDSLVDKSVKERSTQGRVIDLWAKERKGK